MLHLVLCNFYKNNNIVQQKTEFEYKGPRQNETKVCLTELFYRNFNCSCNRYEHIS